MKKTMMAVGVLCISELAILAFATISFNIYGLQQVQFSEQSAFLFTDTFENLQLTNTQWLSSTYGTPRPTESTTWASSGSHSISGSIGDACFYTQNFTNYDPEAPIYVGEMFHVEELPATSIGGGGGCGVMELRHTVAYPLAEVEILTQDFGSNYYWHCGWFNITNPSHGTDWTSRSNTSTSWISSKPIAAYSSYWVVIEYIHNTNACTVTENFYINNTLLGSVSVADNGGSQVTTSPLDTVYAGTPKANWGYSWTVPFYIDDIVISYAPLPTDPFLVTP